MKIKHVKKRQDFLNILANGKKHQGTLLEIYHIQSEDPQLTPGAGVIISKAKAPSAVLRNYVKRVILNYFYVNANILDHSSISIVKVTKDIRNHKKKTLSALLRDELKWLTEQAGVR